MISAGKKKKASQKVDYCNFTSFMCGKEDPNLNIRNYKNETHQELYSFYFHINFFFSQENELIPD